MRKYAHDGSVRERMIPTITKARTAIPRRTVTISTVGSRLTVELSCGPATPARTNNRHCTGLTASAARRATRQLERVVRRRTRLDDAPRLECHKRNLLSQASNWYNSWGRVRTTLQDDTVLAHLANVIGQPAGDAANDAATLSALDGLNSIGERHLFAVKFRDVGEDIARLWSASGTESAKGTGLVRQWSGVTRVQIPKVIEGIKSLWPPPFVSKQPEVPRPLGCAKERANDLLLVWVHGQSSRLTVELSCGPAAPVRRHRHCTPGLTVRPRRVARQLQRLVRWPTSDLGERGVGQGAARLWGAQSDRTSSIGRMCRQRESH